MLSIVTLVRNRNAMLSRLLDGVERSVGSCEVVVVRAGGDEDPADVAVDRRIDVRVVALAGDDERIPYSRARNAGAEAARSDRLCFLDADCIPSAGFVDALDRALAAHDALSTVDVRYLPNAPVVDWSDATLWQISRRHPARPRPPDEGVLISDDHELVWGLCMGMRRASFDRVGGFDTGYGGYAGEDTDLAVALRNSGVPVALVGGAVVFHQHHDSFEPPLGQFAATVANCRRFRAKWGRWPMEGWLRQFRELGLLHWEADGEIAEIVRTPTPSEIEAARRRQALPFR